MFTEDLSQDRNPTSWTNFSQVSQRWRSSALNAPQLWTLIPLNYPRWAQEMLIRSKMAKLTIRGHCLDASNDSNLRIIETIRSCIDEMSRVEEINLTGFSQSTMQKIFRDLPKSAPQLHTLCIDKGIDDFSFPEDFLYNTERLQRVELSFYTISWESQLLTGLTRLTLKGSLNANSSIIQVLHALKRMPALTELRLIDSIPAESGGACIYPVVDLPCLQILHIVSSIGPLTTFLRHITFPHSAILNLNCEVKSTRERIIQVDFLKFLSALATMILSSLVIRSVKIGWRQSGWLARFRICTLSTRHRFPIQLIDNCIPSRLPSISIFAIFSVSDTAILDMALSVPS